MVALSNIKKCQVLQMFSQSSTMLKFSVRKDKTCIPSMAISERLIEKIIEDGKSDLIERNELDNSYLIYIISHKKLLDLLQWTPFSAITKTANP